MVTLPVIYWVLIWDSRGIYLVHGATKGARDYQGREEDGRPKHRARPDLEAFDYATRAPLTSWSRNSSTCWAAKMVAYIAGIAGSTAAVHDYAQQKREPKDPSVPARLRLALRVSAYLISRRDSKEDRRDASFMGLNPQLGDQFAPRISCAKVILPRSALRSSPPREAPSWSVDDPPRRNHRTRTHFPVGCGCRSVGLAYVGEPARRRDLWQPVAGTIRTRSIVCSACPCSCRGLVEVLARFRPDPAVVAASSRSAALTTPSERALFPPLG